MLSQVKRFFLQTKVYMVQINSVTYTDLNFSFPIKQKDIEYHMLPPLIVTKKLPLRIQTKVKNRQ